MPLEREAFIDNYLLELNENIQHIDEGILLLKKDPENEEELVKFLRTLHTIKGSSRMLKFNNIEKIAHGLENVFKGVKEKRYQITNNLIQLVFIATDYLRLGSEKIKDVKNDDFPIEILTLSFEKAYSNEPYNLQELKLIREEASLEKEPSEKASTSKKTEGESPEHKLSEDYKSIRINLEQIDTIIKSMNNLIIKQFQLKKDYELIKNFEVQFNQLVYLFKSFEKDKSSASISQKIDHESLQGMSKDIQKIKKSFFEQLTLIERDTFELQEEIFSLRMFPLELILGSLGKMVEETAISLNKEIDFSIIGKEVRLDKTILEKINDPIIHLVRNSIDHGIESPEERERKGKKRVGEIKINCYAESGNIIIELKDDGQGIDYERVRRKAIEMNPSQEEEINTMSHSELNAFIFTAGFSTKSDVTSLSGRGVGLDIVRYNVEKLKGKITMTSEKDKGTRIQLTLPLSLATVEGYFATTADKKFFLPSNFIKEIIFIKKEEMIDLLNRKAFKLRDSIIPLYYLSHVLGLEVESNGTKKNTVIVVESVGEKIGIIVDSIIEYASLIYKPVPRNLLKQKLIQGIVFDESFNIVNILYIPSLIEKFKGLRGIDLKQRFTKESRVYKNVLVVDDSLNTREIEKSILELEHYNVDTAVDGIDGLEQLRNKNYNLIITDIKMPRMDGITLIENIKRDEKYKSTPIIVITSLEENDFKEKAKSLGVDSIILKSDFDRNNLIGVVKELIG